MSADLLAEVRAFMARWNLTEPQFGSMAKRGQAFVHGLKRGRQLRPETEQAVREFIAAGDPRPKGRFRRGAQKYTDTVRRNAEAAREAQLFRNTDPVEQAKTFIRTRTSFACYEAAITRPEEHGKYFIGAKLVSRDELFEFARNKGWKGG